MGEAVVKLKLWDRRPGEPNLWYDRFRSFMLMGPERSLLGLYKKHLVAKGKVGRRPRKAPTSWIRNEKKWKWRERAEAWDVHFRDREVAEAEDGRRKAAIAIGQAAPDAADKLIELLKAADPEARKAADSILDRSKDTATIHQIKDVSVEMESVLVQLGAILNRYIPGDRMDDFEREVERMLNG